MASSSLPSLSPSQIQPTLVDWNSIAGTMPGLFQLLGLGEAQTQQAQDAVHQQAQQAAQQAQQAGQQYVAAAQPPPAQSPLESSNFLDQLAGNTASVLGRNPDYARQAAKRGEDEQLGIAKQRAANLEALQSTYEQQAMAARQLGNQEAELQARGKLDQIMRARTELMKLIGGATSKTYLEQQQQAGRIELQGARNQGALDVAKLKASIQAKLGTQLPPGFESAIKTTWNGKNIIDVGMFVGKSRDAVMNAAAEQGVIPVMHDQFKVLEDIQGARANADKILTNISPLLSKTAAERWTTGLRNRFGRIFQTDSTLGGYRTWRASAIRALRAAAGSGGLRLNQAEIALAVQNDIPDEMDTYDTAAQKIQNLADMLDSAEDPLTVSDWRTLTPRGGHPPGKPLPQSAAPPAAGNTKDPLGILGK